MIAIKINRLLLNRYLTCFAMIGLIFLFFVIGGMTGFGPID